jgi:flagellar biosynthesis GTPase FlhF
MNSAPVVESPGVHDTIAGREVHVLSDNEPDVASPIDEWTEAVTRTYRGRTVEELIPRIQSELGADAIVLGRREGLTGGFAGFFQHSFVEIEAMAGGPRVDVYDEEDVAVAPPFAPPFAPASPAAPEDAFEHQPTRTPFYAQEPPRLRPNGSYVSEHLAALARAKPVEPEPRLGSEPRSGPASRSGLQAWPESKLEQPSNPGVSDAQEFREYVTADLSDPFAMALEEATSAVSFEDAESTISHGGARRREPAGARASRRGPASSSHGRARANIQKQLIALGVGEQFAADLIDGAATHILPLAPQAGLTQAVRSGLIQRIPVASPLPTRGAAIALVGPGGAGKTSCAAALLGAYRKSSPLPASCATLVRGGKPGELQMLLSPYVMKLTSIESSRAVRALRKTRGEGLLVIDTPPLSPGDRSGIRKLAGLLGELKPERVVIVLPATLGAVAAAQLLQALRPLGANSLAVTHADETDQIGVAVEVACKFGLAPEYMLDRGRSGGWRVGRMDPTGLAAKLLQ